MMRNCRHTIYHGQTSGAARRLALSALALVIMLSLPSQGLRAAQDLDSMRNEATELFSEGKYKSSLTMFREILRLSPGDQTALRHLLIYDIEIKEPYCRAAAAAFFDGDFKTAAAKWEEVLKHDPSDTRVRKLIDEALLLSNRDAIVSLYASADRLMDSGKYSEAAHELTKILEIEPGESRARRLLESIRASIEDTAINSLFSTASDLKARGEYDLAIDALNRILKLDPSQELASRMISAIMADRHRAAYEKARQLYRQGEYIRARDQFSRLMVDLPGDKALAKENGRLKEAVSLIKQAVSRGAEWEAIRISLFNYIHPEGSAELSVAAALYAQELSPSSPAAASVADFAQSRLGRLRMDSGRTGSGLGLLDQYLMSALNNIYEGHYGRAIEECSIVLALESESTIAMKRLGSAFYLTGDRKRALAAWLKASELDPGDKELNEFMDMARGQ